MSRGNAFPDFFAISGRAVFGDIGKYAPRTAGGNDGAGITRLAGKKTGRTTVRSVEKRVTPEKVRLRPHSGWPQEAPQRGAVRCNFRNVPLSQLFRLNYYNHTETIALP